MQEYIASRFNNFMLDRVNETADTYEFILTNSVSTATCTNCGVESVYVHQEFQRTIADLSYHGKAVKITYIQRRFKCKNPHCEQGHFIEHLSFTDGKRPYSRYVVDEIMNNKEKSVRTISAIMDETHKVKIPKSCVDRIIKDHMNDFMYQDIKVLKLDKEQLEKNVDEMIEAVAEVTYSPADYILEEVEKNYSIVNHITESFRDVSDYNTTYPYSLFIMAGLASRMKRLVATSSMPFAFTNGSTINKIGYNLLKKRMDGTYFSNGAFRDYLFNTDETKMQQGFKEFNFSILNNNEIKPVIHILDATKVPVNLFNGNYENASTITTEDGERIKGYKLSALYGLYENQLVHECSHVHTLKTHDLVAGREMLSGFKGFKKGDYCLIDRGYTSFNFFYELYEKGIYIVTPAKKDSEVLRDALSLAGVKINDNIKKGEGIKRTETNSLGRLVKWTKHPNKERKNQEYTTVKGIKLYSEQTDTKTCKTLYVSCVVIRFPKSSEKLLEENDSRKHYYEDDNYYYAVIYTTNAILDGKAILELYEKRMKIEDQFKQLKEIWDLCKLTSTKYKYIVFQLLSTITAMGLVQLFTTLKAGYDFKNCHLKTITMKLECVDKYNKIDVIVASKDVFAIYKLSSIFETFMHKGKKVQQELVKHLRIFESGKS
jgi:histone H3/H4